MLPAEVTAVAFGPLQAAVGLVFLVAFPLRHKLWRPMPLGWWDTPFTQRIHWVAHGPSGEHVRALRELLVSRTSDSLAR